MNAAAKDAELYLRRSRQLEQAIVDLILALNRAGDALAKVQPAIDTSCTWALDIVPQAETEIIAAIYRGEAAL